MAQEVRSKSYFEIECIIRDKDGNIKEHTVEVGENKEIIKK